MFAEVLGHFSDSLWEASGSCYLDSLEIDSGARCGRRVKVLAAEPDNPNLSPRTHVVGGETRLLQVVSWI